MNIVINVKSTGKAVICGIFDPLSMMRSLHFLVLLLLPALLPAQVNTTPEVIVRGVVYDVADSSVALPPMIINRNTGKGLMGAAGIEFKVTINRNDTLIITSGGYSSVRVALHDSAVKNEYYVRIGLRIKVQKLPQVAIYPTKQLEEVKKEREALGVKYHYQLTRPMEMAASPITALYERFSQKERSKKYVAEMEDKDRQEDVLKDLFRIYVKADVIDLDEDEFDKFILYLNLPEDFLKTASEYDLVMAIKLRYDQFREVERINRASQH